MGHNLSDPVDYVPWPILMSQDVANPPDCQKGEKEFHLTRGPYRRTIL